MLVEVADSTFDFDQQVKIPLYCQGEIREVWLVNLQQNYLLQYQNPTPNGYQFTTLLTADQIVTLGAFPEISLQVQEILG